MPVRQLPKIALAVVILASCAAPDGGSPKDTSAPRASVDTTPVTTHDEIEALTRDLKASERDMTATEDSVYVFMGDSMAVLVRKAHASWEEYRKLECDAIKLAYAGGSMAPVAQMECWIDLTDGHRKFMSDEYGYMRNGGLPPGGRSR